MMDLSILIPARNEMFLAKTIENILENIRGETEVIAVCDGNWPDPPIKDHPRVHLIYHSIPIGQRAATNEAARLSRAKFVMKCDAHCAFDEGFDIKMIAECKYDWTLIPRMYNLHAFDWICKKCGHNWYQGPTPTSCTQCDNKTEFERKIYWQPRWNRQSDFMRFDHQLKFQYWGSYKNRSEAQGDLAETMSFIGACWMMHRERFWELGGCDEAHGSWGQMGTEFACKAWLSGGKLMVNKKTWFAHMFRTQGGDFGFPYPNQGTSQARRHSYDLWTNNKWPKAIRKLDWIINHFKPVPDWPEPLTKSAQKAATKGIVYYTDNQCKEPIATLVRERLKKCCNGYEIVSVSHQPLNFGRNIVMDLPRGSHSIFKQIYEGLKQSTAEVVFLVEHDVIYHPSHFEFNPPDKSTLYYDTNRCAIDAPTGQSLLKYSMSPSFLVAYRELLLQYYKELLDLIDRDGFHRRRVGFAPGGRKIEGMNIPPVRTFKSAFPTLDIRNNGNWTVSLDFRKDKDRGGTLVDEIPGWGISKGRFEEFINGIRRSNQQEEVHQEIP
jgi:glycosyltransferase involved in cell wall biosynthesis